MEDLPLSWFDEFAGTELGRDWVGGHANRSKEGHIQVRNGLLIQFDLGTEYASCGIVTRLPILSDFDARVRFTVDNPIKGTTLELAAIQIDPPRESGMAQEQANDYSRSRVYDVHGAPPYVGSEFDEGDGWRINWNRGSAQTIVGPNGSPIADNHFNRYGKNFGTPPLGPAEGWLRLTRTGANWAGYLLDEECGTWLQFGEVRNMNLVNAVYLRVAAKHWSRNGAPAPANKVWFRRFELRVAQESGHSKTVEADSTPRSANDSSRAMPPPTEVRLVQQVRMCRKCDAFSSSSPFGPFLKVGQGEAEPHSETQVVSVRDFGLAEPSVLYGCRKAPIMLIGINPNLPGHFILPRNATNSGSWRSGSYRLLPFIATDKEYAVQHRHPPQPALEITDAPTLDGLIRADVTMLVAPQKGRLVEDDGSPLGSNRAPDRRHARLVLELEDGTRNIYEYPPGVQDDWGQDENLIVARGEFQAGEVVAGFLDRASIGRKLSVKAGREDSYYRNAERLLQAIGYQLNHRLVFGEDMSLHDVVACASPGWDPKWKLPVDLIRGNCVEENRWLHQQVEQSKPTVILVSSRVALQLFAAPSLGKLETPIDPLPRQSGGKEGLFYRVAKEGLWWEREVNGVPVRTRIVLAPHISYGDNLVPHSYFNRAQWDAFEQAEPAAVDWLRRQVREVRPGWSRSIVLSVYGEDDVMVWLEEEDDLLWKTLEQDYPNAERVLRDRWLDPIDLLGGALANELKHQGVSLEAGGSLQRTPGTCAYCKNNWWIIEGGCAYGVKSD